MNPEDKIWSVFSKVGKVSTDTRKIEPGSIFFALKGGNFNGNEFAEKALNLGAAAVVIDEEKYAFGENSILVPDALKALQNLANRYRNSLNCTIVGIGGSNGKTTTKNLLKSVFGSIKKIHATKGNLNNHIGVPLTLLAIPHDAEYAFVVAVGRLPGAADPDQQ